MARREIRDAVTVITGASEGIGEAAARLFAAKGARVILAARSAGRLDAIASDLRQRGLEAVAAPADVTRPEDARGLVESALGRFGRVDILICNAGVGLFSPVKDLPPDAARRAFDVNFFGALHCAQAVLPSMIERKSGLIQMISSVIGRRSAPGYAGYCATKFALYALAESLRVEMMLQRTGVDVQTVYPSLTDTSFPENSIRSHPARRPASLRAMPAATVARRMLKAARSGRRDSIVGVGGRALALLNGIVPGLVDRLMVLALRGRGWEDALALPDRRE